MKTLFPYDVLLGDIRLSITNVVVGGQTLSTNFINPDLQEILFAGLNSERWDEASIEVGVVGPETELAGHGVWSQVGATLQINCGRSNRRSAVALTSDPHVVGRWAGRLDLTRDEWFGVAELRAIVHATVDDLPHRIIGTSETWTVSFDDLPASPVHGSIKITWVNFAEDVTHSYLREFRDEPYYLRLDPDDPSLFLNSGFQGLEALLVDRRRRPKAEEALHDSTRANIAADVWSAMFVAALDAVETDPESHLPEWPEGWQQVVLKQLLSRIYPALGSDDALVEAVASRTSGDGSATLLEKLLPAAASQVRLSQFLRHGIALLEKDADDKETGQ